MSWQPMMSSDVPEVSLLGNGIHTNYPEDVEIFAERQKLYPAGCYIFRRKKNIEGYIISHPWHFKKPPALNTCLKSIPQPAETYYIHDIALVPDARKYGNA